MSASAVDNRRSASGTAPTRQIGHELTWNPPAHGGRSRISALHYYLLGNAEFKKSTRETKLAARDYYLKAIEADPDAAFGYVGMALIFWFDATQRWVYPDMSTEERIRLGTEYAEKAIVLDPSYDFAHLERGDMYFIAGNHEMAIESYKRAAALNPSNTDALVLQADPLIYLRRAEEAIVLVQQAIAIDPITPGWFYNNLARAYWDVGRCAEGEAAIRKRNRMREWDYRALIVNLVCQDKIPEAQEAAGKLLELDPNFTVSAHAKNVQSVMNSEEYFQKWIASLRAAGLPEG